MPLTEHLEELRGRIIWCLVAVVLCTIAGFYGVEPIINWLKHAGGVKETLVVIKPIEVVSVYVKIALSVGAILASPVIGWHTWRFLAPAFGEKLRRSLPSWIIAIILLFLCGAAFAAFVLIPTAYGFLMNLTRAVAQPMITLNSYISFVLAIMLSTGIVFEMPVLAAALAQAGIITAAMMRARRREAIFGLSVAAAVITPTTDVFNMIVFLIPMLLLYEISILVVARAARVRVETGGDDGYNKDN
jgi:sec-independent protein translocase protein TatC